MVSWLVGKGRLCYNYTVWVRFPLSPYVGKSTKHPTYDVDKCHTFKIKNKERGHMRLSSLDWTKQYH